MKTKPNLSMLPHHVMKQITVSKRVFRIVFISLFLLVFHTDLISQSYYRMWRGSGQSGSPEHLSNASIVYGTTGIRFAVANQTSGVASSLGGWVFLKPGAQKDDAVKKIIGWIPSLPESILTPAPIGASGFNLRKLTDSESLYGSFFLGRHNDPTVQTGGHWLRLGSSVGIAMWGDNRAATDDSPHVLLQSDGTLNVQNNIHALIGSNNGGLFLKRGKNGDPTIRAQNNSWLRIGGKSGIAFWGNDNVENDDNPTLSITGNKVGIGTGTDVLSFELEVKGTILSKNIYTGLSTSEIASIKPEIKAKYNMFVGGGILSEDYAIAPKSTWSDFVLAEDYHLPPLSEVSDFISKNKHLPDVPSAQEVSESGYSQHDMNKVLLQKIEELMLYTIEQNKKINHLETELNSLKTQ